MNPKHGFYISIDKHSLANPWFQATIKEHPAYLIFIAIIEKIYEVLAQPSSIDISNPLPEHNGIIFNPMLHTFEGLNKLPFKDSLLDMITGAASGQIPHYFYSLLANGSSEIHKNSTVEKFSNETNISKVVSLVHFKKHSWKKSKTDLPLAKSNAYDFFTYTLGKMNTDSELLGKIRLFKQNFFEASSKASTSSPRPSGK